MIFASNLLAMLDKIDAGYVTGHALLRQQKWADQTPLLTACGDLAFILKMATSLGKSQALAAPDAINFGVTQPFLQALDTAYLAKNNYATLNDYLTALNTATTFSNLIGSNCAYLEWLFRSNGSAWRGNKTPASLIAAANVFAPVTALGTASVGAGGAITFVQGSSIPTANAATVVQTITSTATGGTITLTLGQQTTPALAYNATAAQVQAALQALPSASTTGLIATGGPLGTAPVVCTFAGAIAGAAEGTIFVSNAAATGGTAIVVDSTQGYAPAKGAFFTGTTLINGTLTAQVTYSGQTSAGVVYAGHTANFSLDNLAVSASVTFTPPSFERISAITAITYVSGTATAGGFSVASQIERVTM